MKIVFFINRLYGGGAERVVCNLANHLAKINHQIEIICMTDEKQTYGLSTNIRRYGLIKQEERKCFIIDSIIRLYRLIKYLYIHKVDTYIVFLPVTTILLLQLKVFVKGKIIASERVDPIYYSFQKQKQLRQVAHKADGWVFQTQEERDWYDTTTGNAKIEIIPNAINPDFFKPLYQGEHRKVIVTAGRLNGQKRHDILIKAFNQVKDEYPDYNVEIYGAGDEEQKLQDLINSLNIENRVFLKGNYSPIYDKLKDASLFVLSSDYEGMPNALMEAMALGLPCISTDCDGGGAKFLIENGKNGLLVPKGDILALASAMRTMLSDSGKAMKLGLEAAKIQNKLAPEVIYGKWEEFIKKVVYSK